MSFYVALFSYQAMSEETRVQLRELNSRYVAKKPVLSVEEQYRLIGVASDDENVFNKVCKAVQHARIDGLKMIMLTGGEDEKPPELDSVFENFDAGKTN